MLFKYWPSGGGRGSVEDSGVPLEKVVSDVVGSSHDKFDSG